MSNNWSREEISGLGNDGGREDGLTVEATSVFTFENRAEGGVNHRVYMTT